MKMGEVNQNVGSRQILIADRADFRVQRRLRQLKQSKSTLSEPKVHHYVISALALHR